MINFQVDDSKIVANRPDHLKGVALERDGELNKEFRKELFGGDSHEKQKLDDADAEQIITDMFKKLVLQIISLLMLN